MRFLPLAFCRNFATPFIIQRQLNFIQRAGKIFGSYIAEFETVRLTQLHAVGAGKVALAKYYH